MTAPEEKPAIAPSPPASTDGLDGRLPAIRTILKMPIILGEISMPSAETQTTVGAAGGASALPATPTGYLKVAVNGVEVVVPYYAQS